MAGFCCGDPSPPRRTLTFPPSLIDLIATVAAERSHGAASHAVVGLPGAVDYAAGRLLWAPHLPEQWPDLLSTDDLDRAPRHARQHRQRR